MMTLHLPFPPSVNIANRVGRNKTTGKPIVYSNRVKNKFFADAELLYLSQARKLVGIPGPFKYHLVLNEDLRHGNADGDNRQKYCLDFLQRVGLIENDKLAEGGSWVWGPCEFGAMISVYSVNRVSETSGDAEAA
jgi:hypothetical protein